MILVKPDGPKLHRFASHPDFLPSLSPKEVLLLGAFGGAYFGLSSTRRGINPTLFEDVPPEKFKLLFPLSQHNYFKIFVSERNRSEKGQYLLKHKSWFHWYSEFFYGKRDVTVDNYRIQEWRRELTTFSFYIRKKETEIPNIWVDNTQEVIWKQNLLQFAWNPNYDPVIYI